MMLQVVVYVERVFMRQTLCCKVAKQLLLSVSGVWLRRVPLGSLSRQQ